MLCCGELIADGDAATVLTAERVSDVFQVETVLNESGLNWL